MSVAQKGRIVSEETKAKLRNQRLGVKHSAERKANISKAKMGNRVLDMSHARNDTEFARQRRKALLQIKLADQNGGCAICGKEQFWYEYTPDHIVARAKGGSDDASNCQALCHVCNQLKQREENDLVVAAARDVGYYMVYRRSLSEKERANLYYCWRRRIIELRSRKY